MRSFTRRELWRDDVASIGRTYLCYAPYGSDMLITVEAKARLLTALLDELIDHLGSDAMEMH